MLKASGPLLCILSPVHHGLPAMLAELLQLFLYLVVALFIVGGDVIGGIAFRTIPAAELTFSSSHNLLISKRSHHSQKATQVNSRAGNTVQGAV